MHIVKAVRGRQISATKKDIDDSWERLRGAAREGSLIASALLIALQQNKPFMHTDGGIINLPGHGGWVGDPADPRETILNTIRECDPLSGQLPENQKGVI